jgi:hypothetical protein
VSLDKLESITLGLTGQMKGIFTKQRYKVATVVVALCRDLYYVHLQPSTTASNTLLDNHVFTLYGSTHGVKVLHCHVDNGRY